MKKGRDTNLVYKGYTHRKDGKSGGKQYWRCTQCTACKGRVHTTGEGYNVTVVMYKDHDTHMLDEEKAVIVTVKSKLCEMAKEDPIHPLKRLCKVFITSEDLPDDDDVLIPSFSGCSTRMHRSRHENFPVMPTSREEVKLEVNRQQHLLDRGFYFIKTPTWLFLLLMKIFSFWQTQRFSSLMEPLKLHLVFTDSYSASTASTMDTAYPLSRGHIS